METWIRMDAIRDYLTFLEIHGRKKGTLEMYFYSLKKAYAMIEAAGLPTDPEEASELTYLAIRNAPGLAETTRKGYATVYAQFVEWRTGKDLRKEAYLLSYRPEPQTRRWITMEQFAVLWREADDMERTILALGAFMGLRRFEIATARWGDIRNGRLTVHGKGRGPDGKVVTMLIPDAVERALAVWRRQTPPESDVIMTTYNKDTGEPRVLSPDTIGDIVHRLGRRCGIDVSTHSLRRLFACELDDKGVSPIQIAQLMRHEEIDTTYQCYLRPNRTKLDSIAASMGGGF